MKNKSYILVPLLAVGIFVASAFGLSLVHAQAVGDDGNLVGGGYEAPNPDSNSTNPQAPNPDSNSTNPQAPNPDSNSRPGNNFYLQNPLDPKFNSVGSIIQGFLEIFSYLVILFAVLLLIWVGLQFILARGDAKKLSELKNWLLWIVVGVAVVIGARIIVGIVINTLDATGVVNSNVIQGANQALQGH